MAQTEPASPHAWLIAVPALVALALVMAGGVAGSLEAALLYLLVILLTWVAWRFQSRRARHLRTIGNLLDALREGDYGVRSARAGRSDEMDEILRSFNELASRLQDERRDQQENLQLVGKTLAALDGGVFAFEKDLRLRLVNPAGERLMGRPAPSLLGQTASALGLAELFSLPSGSIRARAFAGRTGRWQITHTVLRSRSQAGHLLLVQPMEHALREEEAQAFGRLVRVLSHEINNSMAPIASMADTLQRVLPPAGRPLDPEAESDLLDGLKLIGQRSTALQRFIGGYAQLAKLPAPRIQPVDLGKLCDRVTRFLNDDRIATEPCANLCLLADPDQLEHVLINLLRNALQAGNDSPVQLRWESNGSEAEIQIVDCGRGLPASENLFVPFFTTKPEGAGIGLVLSRQIIEAQQGSLELRPRTDGKTGAVALIGLPLHTG